MNCKKTEKKYLYGSNFFENNHTKILKNIIQNRALIPVISFELEYQYYSILNEDRKIVLRFTMETIGPDNINILTLYPLRGYDPEAEDIEALFSQYFFDEVANLQKFIFSKFLSEKRYASKFTTHLNPGDSLEITLKKIFSFFLDVSQKNIAGITEDIDSEFLHDFRVGLRKTRTLLTLPMTCISPKLQKDFAARFKKIQQTTNRLRDLDVYLEQREDFKSLIPAEFHRGIDDLFNYLHRERRIELRKVKRHFQTKFFNQTLADWKILLKSDNHELFLPEKCPTAEEFASHTILDLLKKIRKKSKIAIKTEDVDTLHQVRILCKKVRYIVEIFNSFYNQTNAQKFIRDIKKFQTILGDYNDVQMQKQMLHQFLKDLSAAPENKPSIAAIGGMLTTLEIKGETLYQDFVNTYKKFLNKIETHSIIFKNN